MFEKQYKETFSQVVASDRLMQEVLNLKNKKRNKLRGMTLVAAVLLVCALATTAFAYTGFVVYENPGQMLEALFGSGSEQEHEGKIYVDDVGQTLIDPHFQREELDVEAAEEYVAPHIFEVGKSVTFEGNTLTVDAVSYDATTQCGVVYVHLENPNGVPDYYLQTNGELTWNGPSIIRSKVMDIIYFLDESQSTETSLALAGYFYVSDYYTITETDTVPIVFMGDLHGAHSELITLDLRGVTPMDHITLGGGGIQLSPIGIVIHGDKLDILNDVGETLVASVCIRYADGSEYLVVDDTGGVPTMNFARAFGERGEFNDYGYDFAGDYYTNRYCVTYLLNRVVSVNEVAEVIVDGVSYSVDPEPIDTPAVSIPAPEPAGEDIYTIDPTFTIHANDDPVIGQPLEFTEGLSSGTITYSITGAEYIRNIKDIPVDVYDYEVIPQNVLKDLDGEYLRVYSWLDMYMPDYIDRNGNFSDGNGMILVYATVEAHDAIVDDTYDSTGNPDKFQALRLELFNTKDESVRTPNYFSEAWHEHQDYQGHVALMSVDAEDGKNYVVFGFYVGDFNYWINEPVDFSAFCIRGTEGATKDILIPLDLKH